MTHKHRNGEQTGYGPGGNCVCPRCGAEIPHRVDVPCREEKCPQCGTKMLREGSYHHQLFKKKKEKQMKE